MPKYLEFFDGADFGEAVERNVLSSSGFLYDEPRFLFAQDTRSPLTHCSIMRAIAYGNHKPSEIAGAVEGPGKPCEESGIAQQPNEIAGTGEATRAPPAPTISCQLA